MDAQAVLFAEQLTPGGDRKMTVEAPTAPSLWKVVGSLTSGRTGPRPSAVRLSRLDGAVVVLNDARGVTERWKLDGDELVVVRYDPASRTPLTATATGTGVRASESRLTADKSK